MIKTITIQDIRKHGAKGLPKEDVVYLIVNSKPLAAIVPIEYFETLEQMLEDAEDVRDIELRSDEKLVPLAEVFPDLA